MTTNDSAALLDRIFSHEVLKGLEREALLRQRDVSVVIENSNAPLRAAHGLEFYGAAVSLNNWAVSTIAAQSVFMTFMRRCR